MLTRLPLSRRVLARLVFSLGLFAFPGASFLMATSHLIFLGTYTKSASRGIYSIRLDGDTGALSAPVVAAEAPNPAWITLTPDKKRLYTISETAAQAIGFSVDAAAGKLTPLPAAASPAASAPSHLAVDATGRTLLGANYRDGFVESFALKPDGSLGAPNQIRHSGKSVNPTRQEKPHVHSVTLSPDNRFVIVCDLGLDKIFSYALDATNAQLTLASSVATEPGTGPRHFKFSVDGKRGYAINEMGGNIAVYDYNTASGALTPKQVVSTLPDDFKGEKWNAEVRVHPNGRFVYGSNRTHDSIAVFAASPTTGELTRVEIVPSGGKTPRNFAISPDGQWLVCGHQDEPILTVFKIDPATGRLTKTAHTAQVPECVCVLFYD